MDTKTSLWYVLVVLPFSLSVSIVKKGKFVIKEDKRFIAFTNKVAFSESKVECSMICRHSEKCTGANYIAETRTCHLYQHGCVINEDEYEDAPGWINLQLQVERIFHYISNISEGWDYAKTHCESIGGGLANILTTADHEMVLSILTQFGNPNQRIWLSGSDKEKEGEWVWSNGCRFSHQHFNFWKPGQPSNWRGNEHCLEMINKQWNDEYCAYWKKFVCETIIS